MNVFIPATLDLSSDARAQRYLKHEVVNVYFADAAGAIQSREGLNRYAVGDALITGSTGDRWSVSRERFDAKYVAENGTTHGAAGRYRNKPLPVLAIQQPVAFRAERSTGGDVIAGEAGDWLLQYAPGDHGIVENAKFQRVYRLME